MLFNFIIFYSSTQTNVLHNLLIAHDTPVMLKMK